MDKHTAKMTLRKIFAEMSYIPFSKVEAHIKGIEPSRINTTVHVFSAEDTKRWMKEIDAVANMLADDEESKR